MGTVLRSSEAFEDHALLRRAEELAARSLERGIPCYTEFLTLAEQDALNRSIIAERGEDILTFDGGYPEAERRIACFGSERAPIVWLRIAPTAPKFAETLNHRDYLGAFMSLGMRREVIGDILLSGQTAYFAVLESAAKVVSQQLNSVRHTPVTVTPIDTPPEDATPKPVSASLVVSSPRLDALIAAVWKLSRSEAKKLVERQAVFINGQCIADGDRDPAEGDIVSVRGMGRFVYRGVDRETRKGRLRVHIGLYTTAS